jgi:hypothetical protein
LELVLVEQREKRDVEEVMNEAEEESRQAE